MTNYELHYSKFLADLSEKVADFIQKTYISGNIIYDKKVEENKTENFDNISDFENVDNSKIELVEYGQQSPSINKTLLWVIGGIILYNLIRGK